MVKDRLIDAQAEALLDACEGRGITSPFDLEIALRDAAEGWPRDVSTVNRITVSLSHDLAEWVRKQAHDTKQPVSAVIAEALRAKVREERNRRISAALYEDMLDESLARIGQTVETEGRQAAPATSGQGTGSRPGFER